MRTLLILLLSLSILSCGKQPPPVTLHNHDGNPISASDWAGKWVFINYWAEWCKPCAEEIPELNAFARENPDVLVLGIHYDKPDMTKLLQQINAFRIEFPVIVDDVQKAFPHPAPTGLPTTVVINPQGQIVDTLQGPQTRATLRQAMKL